MKKILVIGATGLIGQAVVKQLKRDGYHVRALSRNINKAKNIFGNEVEITEADIRDKQTFSKAFEGIEAVYINLPERDAPQLLPAIIEISRLQNIDHIAYTSGCTVKEENAWHPMIRGHFDAEKLIRESGIPYTIFGLTMVTDMIPRYANQGKPFIMGKQPHSWSWIYSGDFARMVSRCFNTEEAKNRKFTVFGPEKSTIQQAVDQFNARFYPGTQKAKPKPYWMANILAFFIGSNLKYAIQIFKYFENHPEEGNPEEANMLLYRPSTGLKEFFDIYGLILTGKNTVKE